jgi:hypothetical protein
MFLTLVIRNKMTIKKLFQTSVIGNLKVKIEKIFQTSVFRNL